MEEKNKQKKKGIGKYIIIAVVLVCLFGFMIVNRSNDGDLNDYEEYEPKMEVNESEDDTNTIENDAISTMLNVALYVVGGFILLQVINSFRRSGTF